MENNHHVIEQLVHDKICGVISQEDEQRLNGWIAASEDHAQAYYRLMEEDVLGTRYEQYAEVDDKKAWQMFRENHFENKWKRYLPYAAAILVLIVGTWAWNRFDDRQEKATPSIDSPIAKIQRLSTEQGKQKATLKVGNRSMEIIGELAAEEYMRQLAAAEVDERHELTTDDGTEFWITLEDGTSVHMNYGSSLKYPVKFDPHTRTVYLNGEAYFVVSKDNDSPFYVMTDNGVIKVYGTEFNVNTRAPGAATSVVLVKGSVSVTPHNGKEEMLIPGQQATFHAMYPVVIESVDVSPYVAWNEGVFIFQNCQMTELTSVLGHWYGINFDIKNAEIENIRFSGNIDKYEGIDHILKAIEKVTGLNIYKKGDTVVIDK